jgi:hypothetical protein
MIRDHAAGHSERFPTMALEELTLLSVLKVTVLSEWDSA